jgi:hypothetical protein
MESLSSSILLICDPILLTELYALKNNRYNIRWVINQLNNGNKKVKRKIIFYEHRKTVYKQKDMPELHRIEEELDELIKKLWIKIEENMMENIL